MSTTALPGRGAGRPRDPEKREAIIQAATQLFLRDGVAVVSMEAIAAAAAVSKMTLYKYFPDKGTIFEEVVRHKVIGFAKALTRTQAAGGSLEESLCALGRAFLTHICRPESVAAERSLTISLAENPPYAKRFYDAGPARMLGLIAETLAEASAQGELRIEDPHDAASDLLALWLGNLQKLMSLGLKESLSADEVTERIARKTATFLRAYRS